MEHDPVFGDSRLESQARNLKVKGTLIASRKRFLLEQHGRDALERAAAGLEDQAREYLLDPPPVSSWYPNGIMMDMDRAIMDAIGAGAEAMREATRKMAPQNISRLYKVLLRLTPIHALISRLPVVWGTLFCQGQLQSEWLGPQSVRFTLRKAVLPRYMCAHGFCGWLEAVMDLRRIEGSRIDHASCVHQGDPLCSWTMSWE